MAGPPPVLYHGSPLLLPRLLPRPARGRGPAHDMLTAVYATHLREVAIAFALGSRPNAQGHCHWELELGEDGHPRITYFAGGPRSGEVGYVYRVPGSGFTQVAPYQWVAYEPVVPIDHEPIRVDDYLHWVRYHCGEGQ